MDKGIDFVILWVDGNDPKWKEEKNKYWNRLYYNANKDGNGDERFRDWNNLKYWFRAVEKYAPWVRKIHFVTYNQIPEWMNVNTEKLHIVNHSDFIDNKYLPTFNCNPLEINLHRIKGLSENFVYFNDDMFLTRAVSSDLFFKNNLQRECAILYPLANTDINDSFNYLMLSNTGIINDKFNLKQSFKSNFGKWVNISYGKSNIINLFMGMIYSNISGITIPHLPSALKKSTYEEVWNLYSEKLNETTAHKFRNVTDVTQYLFRYWEIMKGNFIPTKYTDFGKCFYLQEDNVDELCRAIENKKYDMICINDTKNLVDFGKIKNKINNSFETVLPEKSSFEL